ncbi:MAG: hypothetical protein IPG66_12190 [Hydrogenophilales bacterium]|nr:hypothetical protein [Hydrogenophilales bacterium]
MKSFNISQKLMSDAIWTRVLDNAASRHKAQAQELFSQLGKLDELRVQAEYNTGSISTATQWLLFGLIYYLEPKVIAEVGTFIGKSAMAMSLAMDSANVDGEIHTCDLSNSMELPIISNSTVLQYRNCSSQQMFEDMLNNGYESQVDMLHLDGRLQAGDLDKVARLCSANAIIVMDDFEGLEKGVANAISMRPHAKFQGYALAYPPNENLLMRYELPDRCTTAMLYPNSMLRMTAQ